MMEEEDALQGQKKLEGREEQKLQGARERNAKQQCTAVFKSGKRKGQQCTAMCLPNANAQFFCKHHSEVVPDLYVEGEMSESARGICVV